MSGCHLRIELDERHPTLAGGTVQGSVLVSADEPLSCNRLTLELGWQTGGRGEIERCEVENLILFAGDWNAGCERYPFTLELPAGPVSYRGHDLSIEWFLLARASLPLKDDPEAAISFELAPDPDRRPDWRGQVHADWVGSRASPADRARAGGRPSVDHEGNAAENVAREPAEDSGRPRGVVGFLVLLMFALFAVGSVSWALWETIRIPYDLWTGTGEVTFERVLFPGIVYLLARSRCQALSGRRAGGEAARRSECRDRARFDCRGGLGPSLDSLHGAQVVRPRSGDGPAARARDHDEA